MIRWRSRRSSAGRRSVGKMAWRVRRGDFVVGGMALGDVGAS